MRGRAIALIGAIVSIGLLIAASWHSPLVLKFIMGAWVLAPFVGYVAAARIFPRSDTWLTRAMLVIVVLSIVAYGTQVFGQGYSKAAAPFVVVPGIAWILLVIAVIAGYVSNKSRA